MTSLSLQINPSANPKDFPQFSSLLPVLVLSASLSCLLFPEYSHTLLLQAVPLKDNTSPIIPFTEHDSDAPISSQLSRPCPMSYIVIDCLTDNYTYIMKGIQ